ncbi:Agamous-like MADS-box protein AGL80 [Bienertia sinuspersici]
MTRKKVKLAFITNDSARKATYKKRKRGLIKKMEELTTLCDVKACAILYSPFEARPVVWPGPSKARDVIVSFKQMPEMEKAKPNVMVSHEKFLRQRVEKAHEHLKKQQKENREKEMTQVMYQCLSGKSIHNMSLLDLSDLSWVINQHLIEIKKRVEVLKKENPNNNSVTYYNNDNNNNNSNTNHDASNNHLLVESMLPCQQVVGHGEVDQGLQGQKGDFDDMQMQTSFMDMMMMGSSMVHQHHHGMGIGMGGGGLGSALSGGVSSRNSNSNMMMMMMGQFGEYHQGLGVNQAMWSNAFFS